MAGAWRRLALVLALVLGVQVLVLGTQVLPPHSSHDGFSLVPQLQKLAMGLVPDDPSFGMFEGTWFPPETTPGTEAGWRPWAARLFGNVRPHTWVDAPHPLALAGAAAAVAPGAVWVPAGVITGYFLALLLSLFLIGCRVRSPRVGLIAATLGAGAPGLFGMSRYVETHLPLVALASCVMALFLHLEKLQRWGLCLATSLLLWSLTRTGEAAGEVVIGGLLVAGPGLAVLWESRRGVEARRWALGFCALVLPCLILADLAFLQDCMESVTRAFADPAVQSDVTQKGGALAEAWTWHGAYLILMATDYLSPLLVLFVPLAGWGLWCGRRSSPIAHRWALALWLMVPLIALSWMQRKASWYGIGLIPPVVVWMALGLDSLPAGRRWAVGAAVGVALLQLVVGSLLPRDAVPDGLARVRQPIPVQDWRLRRLDLLRPVDTKAHRRLEADGRALLAWLDAEHPPTSERIYLAAVVRGSGADYPLRYLVTLARPDVTLLNLADPRARRIGYRGFAPRDFLALIHVGEGLEPWPPTAAQADWLRAHLACAEDDPLDPFLGALMARGAQPATASVPIAVLGPRRGGALGPDRRWSGKAQTPEGSERLCGP